MDFSSCLFNNTNNSYKVGRIYLQKKMMNYCNKQAVRCDLRKVSHFWREKQIAVMVDDRSGMFDDVRRYIIDAWRTQSNREKKPKSRSRLDPEFPLHNNNNNNNKETFSNVIVNKNIGGKPRANKFQYNKTTQ